MTAKRCIEVFVVLAVTLGIAGCGNVYLTGDAMTAAQNSAMDAYAAQQRATSQPASPAWENVYLQENYKQWRDFVRSAKKDTTWGPKLEGE